MLRPARVRFLILTLLVSLTAVPSAEALKNPPLHRETQKKKTKFQARPDLKNWGLHNSEYSSHIEAKRAWAITEGSQKVVVAVIDTGIDAKHRDLNVTKHVNFTTGSNRDCNGHGTHVAGTIGARDNTSDVVGVAPGVALVGVKVLGCDGRGVGIDVGSASGSAMVAPTS